MWLDAPASMLEMARITNDEPNSVDAIWLPSIQSLEKTEKDKFPAQQLHLVFSLLWDCLLYLYIYNTFMYHHLSNWSNFNSLFSLKIFTYFQDNKTLISFFSVHFTSRAVKSNYTITYGCQTNIIKKRWSAKLHKSRIQLVNYIKSVLT